MLKRLVLALGVFAAIPVPAHACTLLDWNIYESHWNSNLAQLVREAATIDWVDIAITAPPRCPDWDATTKGGALNASEAVKLPEECTGIGPPKPGMFAAHIVERLKGASPTTFDLFLMSEPFKSDAGENYPAEKFGFSDLRTLYPDYAAYYRFRERMIANAGHASSAFWNQGVSQFRSDMSDSCGGGASVEPSLRYVVLRARSGAVTALEPVTREDDVLLRQLRGLRDGLQTDVRQSISVEDYFRQTEGLVLARVTACRDDVHASQEGLLMVKQGDATFLHEDDTPNAVRHFQSPDALDFDSLPDYFAFRHERCPVGGDVLLLTTKMSASDPRHHFDLLVERLPPRISYLAGLPRYWGYNSDPDFNHAQPVRVSSGSRVKLSDIQTGFKLTGPDSVSVDDIFRWHEEGR